MYRIIYITKTLQFSNDLLHRSNRYFAELITSLPESLLDYFVLLVFLQQLNGPVL